MKTLIPFRAGHNRLGRLPIHPLSALAATSGLIRQFRFRVLPDMLSVFTHYCQLHQALLLALLLAGFAAGPLAAQPTSPATAATGVSFERVIMPGYELQYRVPTTWQTTRQNLDSTVLMTYVSPDQSMLLFISKLRGGADNLTPGQALYQLTEQFGVPVNKQYATSYHGLSFLETTGTGQIDGRMLRYDALAAHHRGHVVLIYLLATPDAFLTHEPMIQEILHSLAPFSEPKQRRR
ncbi:hypothetical protein D0N36_07840 [Hymenobacter lapidiphilus]|uniref:hypothetical protein n=1 Tax=Hymenobacter sp. CCM 8763 TaxID=2303334 RepID=UPI000E344DF5|nr:hypothetical protein [Hymenobacter sp. CCM 8763]RFP65600.1 hypothetical protein D0N36_07840 [Hymenobacter sp. CCM 8763]